MNKDSVCCVIITYNIGKKLYKCFDSVYNQVDNVVLVDNGSDYETTAVLKEISKMERTHVIFNNDNMGIAYALNKGIRYAEENGFSWILTMDNDSEATVGMVDTMLSTYNAMDESLKKEIISLFPVRVDKAVAKVDNLISDISKHDYSFIKVDMTSGNLLKADVFNKLGYFEEKLFIDSVDTDYCYRVIQAGFKMVVVENSFLLHSLGNVTKRRLLIKNITYTNHSALRRYYISRNRRYIWNKYSDLAKYEIFRDKYYSLGETLKILFFEDDKKNKFKMIRKGIKDYKNNKFGRYS